MLTGLLSQGHFANPPEAWLEQWDPWRVPIGQWGPVFVPAGCVAHWCVIGQCTGVMAAHGVSLGVDFATPIPPTTPHPPTPYFASHPTHPSIINTDGRKGRQKYLGIQPFEIVKVSYNKNQ